MEKMYWNQFYSSDKKRSAPMLPSQFAAFISSEIANNRIIVDLGCGNGRDALFFSRYGFKVIGVDASDQAIRGCKDLQGDNDDVVFICADICEASLVEEIRKNAGNLPIVIYARFFLHAINDDDEVAFFKLAQAICGDDGYIAVEFRTEMDKLLSKVTDAHFRRFIDPMKFLERAISNGFTPKYVATGFGFAKFLEDDAHVARMLLTPKRTPAA